LRVTSCISNQSRSTAFENRRSTDSFPACRRVRCCRSSGEFAPASQYNSTKLLPTAGFADPLTSISDADPSTQPAPTNTADSSLQILDADFRLQKAQVR